MVGGTVVVGGVGVEVEVGVQESVAYVGVAGENESESGVEIGG